MDSTIFKIRNENGIYTLRTYQVFPGIQLIYHDAHIQSVALESEVTASDSILEINHCREGRVESNVNGEYWYLSAGDLSISRLKCLSTAYFPLRHYHGITIRIDLKQPSKSLFELLTDVVVSPQVIMDKFCLETGGSIFRSNTSIEHIFSELYSVPEEIQKGYFKIKILELFLFLSVMKPNQEEIKKHHLSSNQVVLAKEISNYLLEHMDDRITLDTLADMFHISGTQIKNIFKSVFGVSPYAFIRARKMESAAYMLEYTDKSILEIAGEHGYDNGSKFACAFRDVKGMLPNEYRNLYYKQQ